MAAFDRLADEDPGAYDVFLFIMWGWPQTKLAAELGVSPRTVRRRYAEARRQLQAWLAPQRSQIQPDRRYGTYRKPVRGWGRPWTDHPSWRSFVPQEIPLEDRTHPWPLCGDLHTYLSRGGKS